MIACVSTSMIKGQQKLKGILLKSTHKNTNETVKLPIEGNEKQNALVLVKRMFMSPK